MSNIMGVTKGVVPKTKEEVTEAVANAVDNASHLAREVSDQREDIETGSHGLERSIASENGYDQMEADSISMQPDRAPEMMMETESVREPESSSGPEF